MFFLPFLLDDRRIRIQIRIHEAQKHVEPEDSDPDSDPDPQHCFFIFFSLTFYTFSHTQNDRGLALKDVIYRQ
jgi:hypothetical protein